MPDRKMMFLCGAPQSSGSTLVSWCFLQRGDTDGVLDTGEDLLPEVPALNAPNAWCKFTISSFRLLDAVQHLEDEGWTVRPLLITRDPRAIFNSLITKPYGRNSITAEDPPLRLRLRRFHRDWECARERGWPVIRFESFVNDPEGTLRGACDQLGLPWDPAMLSWPKPREQIAAPGHGSRTFRKSRGASLAQTLRAELCAAGTANIPVDDLRWLEEEFADLLGAMDYPAHAAAAPPVRPGRAVPSMQHSRRSRHDRKPLARLRKALRRAWVQLRGRSLGLLIPLIAAVPLPPCSDSGWA